MLSLGCREGDGLRGVRLVYELGTEVARERREGGAGAVGERRGATQSVTRKGCG